MTNQPHPLDVIFRPSPPPEQQEAVDLIDYLSGTPNPAEGSLASVLANALPACAEGVCLCSMRPRHPRAGAVRASR